MKFVYLESKYNGFAVSDEVFAQIEQMVKANLVCSHCSQAFTPENPQVAEHSCLRCFLGFDMNRRLTFVGKAVDYGKYAVYTFIDPQGYIHVSSTTSTKAEQSLFFT